MVLTRLQFVFALVGEKFWPTVPVTRVHRQSVIGVQRLQLKKQVQIDLHACITLRQYSYMPRIRDSVTMWSASATSRPPNSAKAR